MRYPGRTRRIVLAAACLAVLLTAGCATPRHPSAKPGSGVTAAAPTFVLACNNGRRMTVLLHAERAYLFLGGRMLVLARQGQAPNGGKTFGNGQTVLILYHDRARFESGGTALARCTNQPGEAAVERMRLAGVDFRAVGRDPGWILSIRDHHSIELLSDGGTRDYTFPYVPPTSDSTDGVKRYRTAVPGHRLGIAIRPGGCAPESGLGASGNPVVLTLDGHTLHGCGTALH